MNSRFEFGKVVIEGKRKGRIDYLDLLVVLLVVGSFFSFVLSFYN